MDKLSTAETLLTDTTTKPTGDLRITAPIGLGTVWVTQRLREFLELYPDIRIELVLSDEQIAIAMRAADVAIWTSEPQQSDLIRRAALQHEDPRLCVLAVHPPLRRAAVGRRARRSPDHLLQRHAGGASSRHPLAGDAPGSTARRRASRRFSANSVIAMKYAIRAGIGIGLIPDYLTGEEGDLVPVLQDAQLPTVPVYFVYPEELKTAKKVQVFRDFLVAKARQWKF